MEYNLESIENLQKKAKTDEEELHWFRYWLPRFKKELRELKKNATAWGNTYVDKDFNVYVRIKEIFGQKVKQK